MVSREDLEGYLNRLSDGDQSLKELEDDLWVIELHGTGAEVVVNYAPPVVVIRVNIMEVPKDDAERLELMTKLLDWNASDLVHGSYGTEGSHVVLTDALQLENLDFNEFQASFESITLALASHLPTLAKHGEA